MKLTTKLHPVPRSKNELRYTSVPPIRLRGVVLSYDSNITSNAVMVSNTTKAMPGWPHAADGNHSSLNNIPKTFLGKEISSSG
jgi:hypothetical protein